MRARHLIAMLGLVGALLSAGYGALFAVLDDMRDEYGVSESALGAVIGIGFFAGFLAQTTIAPYADRGYARRLVVAGLSLNVLALVAMALSTSIGPMLLSRFAMGIGIGMAVPALRRIAILAEPEQIGRNLGRLLAADVAGFACGPALAAVLVGPFGIPAPFLAAAAAGALALPIVARIDVVETVDPSTQRFAFDLLRQRSYASAVALGCGVFLMIGTFDALWSVALDDLDTAEWIAGLGISLFALPLVIFGSLGGRLAQRIGPFRLGTAGLLAGSVFMLLYGLVPSGAAMFAVAMVHAISDGLTVSSNGVAVGMVIEPERMAGAQGVLGGMQTLVAGITAIVAGVIYDHAGRTAAYTVCAVMMVAVTILGAALAGPEFHLRGERPGATPSPVPPQFPPEPATALD